jgi:hypothetical protein
MKRMKADKQSEMVVIDPQHRSTSQILTRSQVTPAKPLRSTMRWSEPRPRLPARARLLGLFRYFT